MTKPSRCVACTHVQKQPSKPTASYVRATKKTINYITCHRMTWLDSNTQIYYLLSGQMISAEAPVLFAKACELFILDLTMRAWSNADSNRRRTLQVRIHHSHSDIVFLPLGIISDFFSSFPTAFSLAYSFTIPSPPLSLYLICYVFYLL